MKNKNYNFFFITLGVLFLIYCIIDINTKYDHLRSITHQDEVDFEIMEAYNERGSYILNNKYFLSSSTPIIGSCDSFVVEDNAVWRPEGYKHIPRMSDIKAPFRFFKRKNNDTIIVEKGTNKIMLLLGGEL